MHIGSQIDASSASQRIGDGEWGHNWADRPKVSFKRLQKIETVSEYCWFMPIYTFTLVDCTNMRHQGKLTSC